MFSANYRGILDASDAVREMISTVGSIVQTLSEKPPISAPSPPCSGRANDNADDNTNVLSFLAFCDGHSRIMDAIRTRDVLGAAQMLSETKVVR